MTNHPVAAMEAERCSALVASDLKRLAKLLAPELVYVHAPGIVHDRDALLHFLATQVRFSAVERRALAVHGDHTVAWTTGWMRIAGTRLPTGEPVAGVSFVSQVWRQTGPAWQMLLLQSTKVDEANWVVPSG